VGWPAISADGLELFFALNVAGITRIATASRSAPSAAFGPVRPVTELDGPGGEADPFLTPDGTTLYFGADRPGGPGGYDLFVATRACMP
jgi:Tol biopolymer transport system component